MENKRISELNEVYDYISSNDELYHHGVLGMKWGIRRYQPYSLIPRGSGKRGKEIGAAKKSKSDSSSSSLVSKKIKKKSRKQTQEEIKAKKISELQTARQRSEEKQKILKSGNAKLIYENRDSFTRAQMEEAMQRINTEKSLRALVAEQNPSRSTKMKRTLSKVVNAENLQKTADLIEKGANLYNQTARVANVFRDEDHQLKYVGKAENKKPDDNKISKAAMDIIKSGDVAKILENQSSFSNAEVKAAKDRLNDIASIRSQQKGLVKFDTEMVKALDENKNTKRASEKAENEYQKQQREERQAYLKDSIQSIEQIKKDYGEGGINYLGMTPSPIKSTSPKVTTSKDVLDADASLFTPSTRKSKKFDSYFESEVSKVNPYGDIGSKKLSDLKKSASKKKSKAHGVKAQKWETSNSDFGRVTTNKEFDKYFESEVAREKRKKNLSHSDISVSELYHHGVLGMKWGIRRYQSYDTVPRGSGKGGKELINKDNDPDVQAMIDSEINDIHNISFEKHGNYYSGSAPFGKNSNCEVRIRNKKDKSVAVEIIKDGKLESYTKKAAADLLFVNQDEKNKLPKSDFQKQTKCSLVDIGDFNIDGKRADVAIHYSGPTSDFQSFYVESKSHTIIGTFPNTKDSKKSIQLWNAEQKGVYSLDFLETIQNKGLNDKVALKEYSKFLDDPHKYMTSEVDKLPDEGTKAYYNKYGK